MELETDTAGRRYAERRATAAAQRDNLIALINTWNEATSPSTPRTVGDALEAKKLAERAA